MFEYWLYQVCDSWSYQYHDDNDIKIEDDEITAMYSIDNQKFASRIQSHYMVIML